MPIANRRGHCLCGAIEYQFDEQPNWVAHCHCESCRRATSSPMTTWVSVPRTGATLHPWATDVLPVLARRPPRFLQRSADLP